MKKLFRILLLTALAAMSLCAAASAQDYYVNFYADWNRLYVDVGGPEGTAYDAALVDSATGRKVTIFEDVTGSADQVMYILEAGHYDRYEITDSASGAVIEEGELYAPLTAKGNAFTHGSVAALDIESRNENCVAFYGLDFKNYGYELVYNDGGSFIVTDEREYVREDEECIDREKLKNGATLYAYQVESVDGGEAYLQDRSVGIPMRLEGAYHGENGSAAVTNPHFVKGGEDLYLVWDRHVPYEQNPSYQIDVSEDGGKTWSEGYGSGNGSWRIWITYPGTYMLRIATQVNDETVATCVAEGLTLTVREDAASAPANVRFFPLGNGDHVMYVSGLTPGGMYFGSRTSNSGGTRLDFEGDANGCWAEIIEARRANNMESFLENDGYFLIQQWTSKTLSADSKRAEMVFSALGGKTMIADCTEDVNPYDCELKMDGPALTVSIAGAEEDYSYFFRYDDRNWSSKVRLEGSGSAPVLANEGVWEGYTLSQIFTDEDASYEIKKGTLPKMIRSVHEAFVVEDEVTAWESKKTIGNATYYGTQFAGLDFENYVYLVEFYGDKLLLTEDWANMNVQNLRNAQLYAYRTTEQSDAFLQERSCAIEVTVVEPPAGDEPSGGEGCDHRYKIVTGGDYPDWHWVECTYCGLDHILDFGYNKYTEMPTQLHVELVAMTFQQQGIDDWGPFDRWVSGIFGDGADPMAHVYEEGKCIICGAEGGEPEVPEVPEEPDVPGSGEYAIKVYLEGSALIATITGPEDATREPVFTYVFFNSEGDDYDAFGGMPVGAHQEYDFRPGTYDSYRVLGPNDEVLGEGKLPKQVIARKDAFVLDGVTMTAGTYEGESAIHLEGLDFDNYTYTLETETSGYFVYSDWLQFDPNDFANGATLYACRNSENDTAFLQEESEGLFLTLQGGEAPEEPETPETGSYGVTLSARNNFFSVHPVVPEGTDEKQMYDIYLYSSETGKSFGNTEFYQAGGVIVYEEAGTYDCYRLLKNGTGEVLAEGKLEKPVITAWDLEVPEGVRVDRTEESDTKYRFTVSGIDLSKYGYELSSDGYGGTNRTEESFVISKNYFGDTETLYVCIFSAAEKSDAYYLNRSRYATVTLNSGEEGEKPTVSGSVSGAPEGATVEIKGAKVEVKEDGSFSIEAAEGKFDVVIKTPGALTHTVKNVEIKDGSIALPEIKPVMGDTNGDDMINIMDMGAFRANFGKVGANIANEFADVNGDNMVNIMDMGTFRMNFGKTAAKDCTMEYGA